MKFTVYGENVTINEKMQAQIEERLSGLNKYVVIDEDQFAKVSVRVYGDSLKVEVNVPSKIGTMTPASAIQVAATPLRFRCPRPPSARWIASPRC